MSKSNSSLGAKVIKELRALVQVNDHGAAYLLAAKKLGFDDLAQRFSYINRRHLEMGHLPRDLYEARFGAYSELMERARGVMSAREHRQFHLSF